MIGSTKFQGYNFKDTRLACVNWTKRQTLTQDHDQTLKNVNFV